MLFTLKLRDYPWLVVTLHGLHTRYCNVFSLCSSLKLECEKLASEKIEIQRHYVMVSIFLLTFQRRFTIIINL